MEFLPDTGPGPTPRLADWDAIECIVRLAIVTGDEGATDLAARRLAETADVPGPFSRPLTWRVGPADLISFRISWAYTCKTKLRRERAKRLWEKAHDLWYARWKRAGAPVWEPKTWPGTPAEDP